MLPKFGLTATKIWSKLTKMIINFFITYIAVPEHFIFPVISRNSFSLSKENFGAANSIISFRNFASASVEDRSNFIKLPRGIFCPDKLSSFSMRKILSQILPLKTKNRH